ncbi:hypothetical protein SDC9_137955 [bioreactor metagenome]|uniref:Uncharacterized protein n=1 Tax=bioreactor metagenome TaxID=1076179 RepID=A0A645DPY0_9ZZZZ
MTVARPILPASCCFRRGSFLTAVPGWISSSILKIICISAWTVAARCRSPFCCVPSACRRKKFSRPSTISTPSTCLPRAHTSSWCLIACVAKSPVSTSPHRMESSSLPATSGSLRSIFASLIRAVSRPCRYRTISCSAG